MFNFVVLYSLIAAMSPKRPSSSNKGKKISKPRNQPRYIIKVLNQTPHSAPIQAPSPFRVPTPHPAMATTPSTSTPQPSHTRPAQSTPIQSPSPIVVPIPLTSTP